MNTKLMATIFFLGALAIGAVAGIFIDRAFFRPPLHENRPFGGPHGPGDPMLRHFSHELGLTPAQQDKLAAALENYRGRFGNLRRSMHPRYLAMRDSLHIEIRAMLAPEQQKKFDEMNKHVQMKHRRMHAKPRQRLLDSTKTFF